MKKFIFSFNVSQEGTKWTLSILYIILCQNVLKCIHLYTYKIKMSVNINNKMNKQFDKLTLLENIKNNDLIKEGNYTDKEINLFNEIIKDMKKLKN